MVDHTQTPCASPPYTDWLRLEHPRQRTDGPCSQGGVWSVGTAAPPRTSPPLWQLSVSSCTDVQPGKECVVCEVGLHNIHRHEVFFFSIVKIIYATTGRTGNLLSFFFLKSYLMR
uniref:Uncharacterized protein n=1 Tax=Anguilla anguilla TaxID=7936 RepID=A0A0E9X9X5_ANGAN